MVQLRRARREQFVQGLTTSEQAHTLAESVQRMRAHGSIPSALAAVIGPILAASDDAVQTAFWERLTAAVPASELDAVVAQIGSGKREKINPITLRVDWETLNRLRVYQATSGATLSEAIRDCVKAGLETFGY